MIRLCNRMLVIAVFLYLYVPILILIGNGFNQSRFGNTWKGFTLQWFEKLATNEGLLHAAGNSLLIALLSATIATVIGGLGAIALYRYPFRGKGVLGGLVFVQMMSPDIVIAISFLAICLTLGIGLGFTSLLLAHVTFCLPFVIVTVYSRLRGFDIAMLEAARDLGAGEWTAIRKILLPLTLPGLAAGWLLSFTLSLDDVIVSSFVTGPMYETLPIRVYSMVKVGISPEINALATALLVLSLVLVAASQWLLQRKY